DDIDAGWIDAFQKAIAPGLVGLDDQQSPRRAAEEITKSDEQMIYHFPSLDRLGDESQCSGAQSALTGFVGGNDAYGYMARLHVVFESIEHAPTFHVGEKYIKRQRVRLVLARHLQGGSAQRRDQTLETLFARGVQQKRRKCAVVFDDQQHPVARGDI